VSAEQLRGIELQGAFGVARQHYDAGRLDQAETVAKDILVRDPANALSLGLLGAIELKRRRPEAAAEWLRRAVASDRTLAGAHSNLGTALHALGKLDEAAACFRQALALAPQAPEAHYNLARVHQARGDSDAAIAGFRRALLLKPDHANSRTALAAALKSRGRLHEDSGTVVTLLGQSAYDSFRGLVPIITRHWQEMGLTIGEIDLSSSGWHNRLVDSLCSPGVRFAFSLGGGGIGLKTSGKDIWSEIGVPVFCLLCDHPAYFAARHQNLPRNAVLGYMFRDHALFQRDHVKTPNVVTSIDFGVPAAPLEPSSASWRNGQAKVVFAKTGNDPRDLEALWQRRPAVARIIHDLVDEVGLANCGCYPAAVEKVAAAHRLEVQPFDKLARFLIAQVDDYVRRRKSTAIAEAIKSFPVDIFGERWDHVARAGSRARFHGGIDYHALEGEIAGSTASITMNPNVDLSAHDRVFTALGAGVMPVTDGNSFVLERLPKLAPFTFTFEKGSIEGVLERIFARPREAIEIAQVARAQALATVSTRHTARHILNCMELVDFLEVSFVSPQNFFIP
jgi:tetratricopeptide (TPR) repeat protein